MDDQSALITVGLPIALAIIMLGLGLSLRTEDFRRVARSPRAVVVAMVVQVIVLPALAFGLVTVADLDGYLAVGVMLLVASPGGTTANLFSHLFRGDVALNISLTAVNSVLAVFTIPVITNLAIRQFAADDQAIGMQFSKVLTVIAIVLVPVGIGMVIRSRALGFATRADRPVRIFSIVVLVIVSVGAIVGEKDHIGEYVRQIGWVVALLCALSLIIGYGVARVLQLGQARAVAIGMEIGIHNTTVALTIALSVIEIKAVAVPAAVYSIVMYLFAPIFGLLVTRARGGQPARTDASH